MLSLMQKAQFLRSNATSLLLQKNFHVGSLVFALNNPIWHEQAKKRSQENENEWYQDMGAWTEKNKILYPPLHPDQGIRPAEIYHGRAKIRHSAKKMFHITHLVRNMNVDEAIYKLDFVCYRGNKSAKIVREILLEAQDMAVNEHNVEFKSNLHIAHSFACPHSILPFRIYRAAGRPPCKGSCRFSNYYVMLREGPAAAPTPKMTALDKALEYVSELKERTILDGM